MCNHTSRIGDNYGESCSDCGEQLRGFGYGGFFGNNIKGNEKCIHLYAPMGDGGAEICIFCENMKPTPSPIIPTGTIPESVCPRCGHSLVVATKRNALRNYDGSLQHPQFVGCTQYPMCGYVTSKITPEIVLKMEAVQAERDAMPVEF